MNQGRIDRTRAVLGMVYPSLGERLHCTDADIAAIIRAVEQAAWEPAGTVPEGHDRDQVLIFDGQIQLALTGQAVIASDRWRELPAGPDAKVCVACGSDRPKAPVVGRERSECTHQQEVGQ